MAIEHANTVIQWQENLVGDELPPEWMWPVDSALEEWFQEVEIRRNEKYGGGAGGEDDLDLAGMMSNDLAKKRKE